MFPSSLCGDTGLRNQFTFFVSRMCTKSEMVFVISVMSLHELLLFIVDLLFIIVMIVMVWP